MKREPKPAAFDLKVEFDRETDGRWIADIPALPGVMVYGRTRNSPGNAIPMEMNIPGSQFGRLWPSVIRRKSDRVSSAWSWIRSIRASYDGRPPPFGAALTRRGSRRSAG